MRNLLSVLLFVSLLPLGLVAKEHVITAPPLFISDYLRDSEPLESAIHDAADGSVIIIDADIEHRNGKYIEVTKNLKVKGDNKHAITLNCKELDEKYISGNFIYAHGDIKFVMEDLIIDGGRPLCHPQIHDLSKFIVTDCREFIFHHNTVQHTTYWYDGTVFNSGVLKVGYPEKTFMDITNYEYAEVSDCTFKDLFSNEGIGIYCKRNKDINNDTGLEDYAKIINNKFVDDIILDGKTLQHKTGAYVSSWVVTNNIRCLFANNYVGGSDGSNVNLHCHNSIIENNEFNWSVILTPNINLDHGGDSGIIPHDIIIRNNIFRSPWAAIQMASGYNITIENNIHNSLPIENPTEDEIANGVRYYRQDCAFVYHYRSGRTQALRQNTNITISHNVLNNVRYLFYNPGDDAAIFDSLTISFNKVKQDNSVAATPIIRGYFNMLRNSMISDNSIKFSNKISSDFVYMDAHPARIVLSLKPYDTGTRLDNVSIINNVFTYPNLSFRPTSFIAVNSELRDGESVVKRAFQPHIIGITVSGNRFLSSNFFVKHRCDIYTMAQYVKGVYVGGNNVSEYGITDSKMMIENSDKAPMKIINYIKK